MKTNWPALGHGYLILAGVALASSPLFAQTQAPAAATSAVISSVAITQAPERSAVRVEGEGRLDVHAGRMQNPDRLGLDFAGARLAVQKTVIPGISAPVRGVRIGQYRPDVARVVVDLTTATPYQISRDGEAVVIYFETPSTTPVEPVSSATTLTLRQSEKARQEFRYSATSPRLVASRSSKDWKISAPRFALPGELTQPSITLASFGGKKEPVRPDSATQQAAAQQAVQQANTAATTMATSSATQAPAGAAPAPAAGKYTGEPISVNLKDVDLKDFFRLIHEISGLNVVLDPAVKGNLTLVLDDVPWDQALDIVLKNNDLDRKLEGNVLRVATIDTLEKEAKARQAQQEAETLAVEKVTVTRFLSYARSKDVVATAKKLLSVRGDVIADDRTNALIVQDIPAVIPNIDRLLAQLDRKTQEVEIEARVVAATRSFARDIGTQFGFGWGNGTTAGGGAVSNGAGIGSGISAFPGAPLYQTLGATSGKPGGQIPLFSNLGATSPTSGLSFINYTNNIRIDAVLTMAESRGLLKILSRPRVVTQNNIQALVTQGVRVPIVTQAQLGGPPTVTYVDAFLRLTVTPQITSENTIFLNVDVENTTPNFGQQVQGNPELITQQATTQVLVTDGGTVVIGGVIQTQNSINISQVPLLGNIPILGNLFKHTQVQTSNQELIFFITPRIIQT